MVNDFTTINFVLDFDSTFVKLEGLEEFANIALCGNPEKEIILSHIYDITNLGMTGKISFEESLNRRIKLFQPQSNQLGELVKLLKSNITNSIEQNINFFRRNSSNIYVISGGFMEWILPVLVPYEIPAKNIFANEFLYSNFNEIIGIDLNKPLSKSGGKVATVASLNLSSPTIVVGDGYTDFEIRKAGVADKFVMFAENIHRPIIENLADLVVKDWNELLQRIDEIL